jgi:predicted phosphodiesterase
MPQDVEREADEVVKRLSDKRRHEAIASLEAEGFRITKQPPKERATAKLDLNIKPGGTVRIGIVSDTHIGSKFQQITALTDFYRYADDRGAAAYLHGGDILEGIHQAHRDAAYEQYAFGVDEQVAEVAAQYPRSKNAKTFHVAGNHDDWAFQNVGVTSGAMIQDKRDDLEYLGYHSAFVEVGSVRFLVQHGSKGGNSYAKSYRVQKLVEGLADSERAATDIALFGHWHNDAYLGRYMGVLTFMLPCFKGQDRFLRMLGKNPTIGGLVLELEFTRDRKIWNVRQDWRLYESKLNDYPGAR